MKVFEGFLIVLLVLGLIAWNVWLTVIVIQFLRTGTMAFRRYLNVTQPSQVPPRYFEERSTDA